MRSNNDVSWLCHLPASKHTKTGLRTPQDQDQRVQLVDFHYGSITYQLFEDDFRNRVSAFTFRCSGTPSAAVRSSDSRCKGLSVFRYLIF